MKKHESFVGVHGDILKNKKGITLIALVVTIIILIILASVSINMILDKGGIIDKAHTSAQKYERAQVEVEIQTALLDARAEAINNGTTLTAKKFAETLEKQKIATILDDADSNYIMLKNPQGYIIELKVDGNGNIGIEISDNPIKSTTTISITPEIIEKNTNSITVGVTGNNNEGANYTYTILLDGTRIATKTTTETSYTFNKLTHNTTYTITVKANNNNGLVIEKISEKTDEVKGLAVGGVNWLREGGEGKAEVTITNTSGINGSKIKYKKTGDSEYTTTEGTEATATLTIRDKEEQIVEAILDDGTGNIIGPVYRKVKDTTPPEANIITQPNITATIGGRITAKVEFTDAESGINPSTTIFTNTGTATATITSDIAETTPDENGKRTVTVSIAPNTEGTVILNITPKDYATNTGIAVIANEITVSAREGIIGRVAQVTESGYSSVTISGKLSNGTTKTETYNLHTIVHNGDLELNGTTDVTGATLTLASKTYSFGESGDIGNRTVALVVNGNLTINSGVKLTAVGNTNGGPKGLVIYCTGTLTNNGEIFMTARGAKAAGQNIFLLENEDGSFEYVPDYGGTGGGAVSTASNRNNGVIGTNGTPGSLRGTRRRRCRGRFFALE